MCLGAQGRETRVAAGTTDGRGQRRETRWESGLDRKLTCLPHGLLADAAPLHLPPTSPSRRRQVQAQAQGRAGAQTDLLLVLTPDPQQLCAVLLLELGRLGLELQLQPPFQVAQLGLMLPAPPAHLVLTAPLQLRLLPLQLLTLRRMEGWGQGERHVKSWSGRTGSAGPERLQPPRVAHGPSVCSPHEQHIKVDLRTKARSPSFCRASPFAKCFPPCHV